MAIIEPKRPILEAKMAGGNFLRGLLKENGGMAEAYSEARIERVQLELGKIPYAGHP